MSAEQDVVIRLQSQSFQHITSLDFFKIHSQNFGHRRSGNICPFLWHSHFVKVFSGRFAVRKINIRDNINYSSVGFFRQTLIFTSVTCFHVKQRNMKPLCRDSGQTTIRVSKHQISIRLKFG